MYIVTVDYGHVSLTIFGNVSKELQLHANKEYFWNFFYLSREKCQRISEKEVSSEKLYILHET